jgi:hypothetical protein
MKQKFWKWKDIRFSHPMAFEILLGVAPKKEIFTKMSLFLNLLFGFMGRPWIFFVVKKLNFPPVVFVMLWNCLSQQLQNGSLLLGVDFMPDFRKIESPERAPTWFSRFKILHSTRQFTGGIFSCRLSSA